MTRQAPPDQIQRERALDPHKSILVQAPAGSGKTDLLTRRFLRLLSEVDDPGQIVAITFTKAAAAEMRHRILAELAKAETLGDAARGEDEFAMPTLARRALLRSRSRDWNLLDLPAQLRISTIDSFCRDIALQEPLLSGLGGGLDITEDPSALYHRAARRTLEQITEDGPNASALVPEIERLLLHRDNGWQDLEKLLVEMLRQRDRWMQDFVLSRESEWEALRERLERPFARAVAEGLAALDRLLDQETRDEAMDLARFACGQRNNWLQCKLFNFAGQPCAPFVRPDALDTARQGYLCLADLLLTQDGNLRQRLTVINGFPADRREEKARVQNLISRLRAIPDFESTLDAMRKLPPARYSEEDWQIIRSCFTMLRHAAGELQVAFAEAGVVDFTEVAQAAQRVLLGPDRLPTDTALKLADGIRHLLVDEFQDTSRRQHKLIGSLVGAWPDPENRSVFVVGDPMQSIYFFRDADAELFPRVRTMGLEIAANETFPLDYVPLSSNFRTAPELVQALNKSFEQIFATNDGSGVTFSAAAPARPSSPAAEPRMQLHIDFIPKTLINQSTDAANLQRKQAVAEQREATRQKQIGEIVTLIRTHLERARRAALTGDKYRIAVLGRTRSALDPIARALREARIPFRAVDLEKLSDRQEVLDALALARALFNPEDRVAWLGLLRSPWCGLSLADVHTLTSSDDPHLLRRTIPSLFDERAALLSEHGRQSITRLVTAYRAAMQLRAANPSWSLGTWLENTWLQLGGADCVDSTARANLELFWACLDHLQNGEPDLFGPGLSAALDSLTAEPDPTVDSANGVNLMTVHKAKGLEFEVVIVPELQAGCGRSSSGLLSWLERGLATPDDSEDVTEFLIAPLPSKGADRGATKHWVDAVRNHRESQEQRRILYVAATRAREQLHLFARPEFKTEQDGTLSLCEPSGTLLHTAWPAIEEQIRARFDKWILRPEPSHLATIAASAENNLLPFPPPAKPALVRRLPLGYRPPEQNLTPSHGTDSIIEPASPHLYQRHEGGEQSRALGVAVHTFFEQLARLRATHDWTAARAVLASSSPRVQAQLRAAGLNKSLAAALTADALEITLQTSRHEDAQWILSPHPDAATEVRWAGVLDGKVYEVRVDRIFRAGSEPHSEGDSCWWIVDYKTAAADPSKPEAFRALRSIFAPQLERYAEMLRKLHGRDTPVHAALYYPRMLALDWWVL
jgi:ATP-dependent exoDNAse (exonuclease V) beta subunit